METIKYKLCGAVQEINNEITNCSYCFHINLQKSNHR